MSSTSVASPETAGLRKWPLVLTIVVALFGVFVGALLTWHHDVQLYSGAPMTSLWGCAESESTSCDTINTSAWSELAGVPLGVWAIVAYGLTGALAGLALQGRRAAHALLVVGGVVALACSAFLYYQSKVELGMICAWCFRLYIANAGLLALSVLAGKPDFQAFSTDLRDQRFSGVAGGALLALLVVGIGGERVYRHQLLGDAAAGLGHQAVVADVTKSDQQGDAPILTFTVQTEDGKTATFSTDSNDPWRGKKDAKVAVVEFGDLECGYCKRASAEIERLYQAYGDRVLFVWKNFPMNPDCNGGVKNKLHKYACQAAVASECARRQGHYWEFQTLAFKNQHQLGPDYLRTYAGLSGNNLTDFDKCGRDPSVAKTIRDDADVGASLGIHGTPRIWINDKLYRAGTSAEAMAKAIEEALGASSSDAAQSAAALHADDNQAIQPIPADVPAMQDVKLGSLHFKIDTFESSVGKDGKAHDAKHEIPSIRTSWFEAKAACEAAGKRLCTEQEWVSACQGAEAIDDNHNGEFADDMIEGTAYPYGDFHDDGRCWDGHEEQNPSQPSGQWRPVYTGEMPGCVTPSGVYDMTGNVEEWVGDSPEHAVLLGGAWDTSEDHARCYRRNDTFGAGYANPRTGFRCCADD